LYKTPYTVSQKKNWTLFHLSITLALSDFNNSCRLALLQTEINCDQVYAKIYHRTPNLLVHYFVKWTRYGIVEFNVPLDTL